MRLKAILTVWAAFVIGCSSPGGSGPNGSDGATGEDGKNGQDGADGEPGAPGPAGKDAASSGSRIKARWRVGEDGSREFVGWFDSELQARCSFAHGSDGVLRCLPGFASFGFGLFSDAQCSKPVIVTYQEACGGGKYAWEGAPGAVCYFEPRYEVMKIGAPIQAVYALNSVTMTCVASSLSASFFYFEAGPVVGPSELAAAAIETDP